ncbi:tol-pal system protein YbgF [Celeribacter indicus]|uniref:Cell division coordinator CpoB n=1 Tax=Celeribacter indicus TaxID=1208324 RepID=A0A0B5E0C7_9RHOB|nr:tol-pal system protein YbgF [Celeribacter indicus]AJE45912.1 tetratricopeptide TPR_2 repeat protein [Celeribacter indicus]SDW63572.1 tol-pal system protein YbgF [Celeribacter indicus]
MKRLIFGAALAFAVAGGGAVAAQDAQTLADIRQEASVLSVEIAKLRRELSTTAAPNAQFSGGSTLERVDAMEAALAALTSKVEALEFRVEAVVKDGTNQLDDLNFRLCELESGCDVGNLPPLTPLGGESGATDVVLPAPGAPTPAPAAPEGSLAMTEQSDFDAAKALYDAGNYQEAADAFGTFATTYTGGYLTGEAHYMRGEALSQLGRTADAARAYLDSFSGSPEGDRAPEALRKLAGSLGTLGQVEKACVMYNEVQARFPGSATAQSAVTEARSLGCQ